MFLFYYSLVIFLKGSQFDELIHFKWYLSFFMSFRLTFQ